MVGAAFHLLRWFPWGGAAVAAFFALQSMLGQVAIQSDLNAAMQGVLGSVRQAGALTRETAVALRPLANTAATMEAMNSQLRITSGDLGEINATMGRLAGQQEAVVARLAVLNERTGGVVEALGAIDRQNREMYGTSAALTRQTYGQAGALNELSGLTGVAIEQLRKLNRKFAFLRSAQ